MAKAKKGFVIKTNKATEAKKDDIKYEVIEKLGVLGERKGKGGRTETLELRYVAWNGRDPKYDIRPWYVDEEGNEGMSKGVTMSGDELLKLREILDEAEAE